MRRLIRIGLLAGVASILAVTSLGIAVADDAVGRQRVERFLEGLQGLDAEFDQTLTDRAGRTVEESSGTLAIRRPNRFRWDYLEPTQQVIVADGTRVWFYDKDLEQVTVRKLDDTLSATPAMLLSGEGKLEDNFEVVEYARDATSVEWVRLEPKRKDTDFRWVRLGFAGEALKFMELADKLGQVTTLELRKFRRNPSLDVSRFTFKVPPGADVIGNAGTPPVKQ